MSAERKLEQLAQRFEPESRLIRSWPLKGGISSLMLGFELVRPNGQTRTLVLRQPGDGARNQQIAAHEFRLLQGLHAAGLPVPMPCYLDESGEIFALPCLITEYIEGTAQFAPADVDAFLARLAAALAQIHGVDTTRLTFLPRREDQFAEKLHQRPASLDPSSEEAQIRRILEAVWPLPPLNQPVLLHGDFWPGNLLWQGDQLAAVIDWEDAALGDPLADVANARLEVLWAFGSKAMHGFTRHYQSLMPAVDFTHLPYRDLSVALERIGQFDGWGLDAATIRRMRERHESFIAQALATLFPP